MRETCVYTHNDANELITMNRSRETESGSTDTVFAYDAWGWMTSEAISGGASATYAYDYDVRLKTVSPTFPGEGNVTRKYGGDGRRRARTQEVHSNLEFRRPI